jgi:hypothetical protein
MWDNRNRVLHEQERFRMEHVGQPRPGAGPTYYS